jgi:bifunctional UDP-N-acetylglucosamine pyrophosphorylase/glucosamine-1-phosphate N-acetyltransferase
MSKPLCTVVLAAGAGTRMRSTLPKPLHEVCGRSMAHHVIAASTTSDSVATVVVVGHDAARVSAALRERATEPPVLLFALQDEQLGTGHAVLSALDQVDEVLTDTDGDVLVIPGDTPLIRRETLVRLVNEHRERGADLSVLTALVDDPTGYGRIVRGTDGRVMRIVEHKDAHDSERAIREVNTGIMLVRHAVLRTALGQLSRDNAQQEYYLTDLLDIMHRAGQNTVAVDIGDPREAAGVNDPEQLAHAQSVMRERVNAEWIARGVVIHDSARTHIDVDVTLQPGVIIWPHSRLRGRTSLAADCEVGPGVELVDCVVGPSSRVHAVSWSSVRLGARCRVADGAAAAPGDEFDDDSEVLGDA